MSNRVKNQQKGIRILLADDDKDDRFLTQEAFRESGMAEPIDCVRDGVDLMDYLKRRGQYTDKAGDPLPGLILLDLNMPRKNGFEALEEIRNDEQLCVIPVIILTTSSEEDDIRNSYCLGGNSFLTKPTSTDTFIDAARVIREYWFEKVWLPHFQEGA